MLSTDYVKMHFKCSFIKMFLFKDSNFTLYSQSPRQKSLLPFVSLLVKGKCKYDNKMNNLDKNTLKCKEHREGIQ